MRYRKKPVIVDAFRYGYDPIPDWLPSHYYVIHYPVIIDLDEEKNLKEFMTVHRGNAFKEVRLGDYVLKTERDEFLSYQYEDFQQIFESIEEQD
jgi:hypothetical protein